MTLQGEQHPNWKGGRYIDSYGYVLVQTSPKTYIREHRLVMQEILGRPLAKHETVHHKNGNKQDNRPENLEVLSNSAHTKHHWDTGDHAKTHIKRGMAECHPERPHHAKGMCKLCYLNEAQKKYVSAHKQEVTKRQSENRQTEEYRAKRRAYRRQRYEEFRKQGYSADEIRRFG